MKIRFYTSTPQTVARGSGTYVALSTLVESLRCAGVQVEVIAPKTRLPNYTAERLLYNRWIAGLDRRGCDFTVGIDLDGYRAARSPGPPHVAALKGVIADELLWEKGVTRWLMGIQARREKLHVERASQVVTPSRYSARRVCDLYGLAVEPVVIPEPIDLGQWRQLLASNPAEPDPSRFTILCACRFFPRKRVETLLRSALLLRKEIPGLRLRIVGDGPEEARLRTLAWDLDLSEIIDWLGIVDRSRLAVELQLCDVFCLPTLQESFGMVFLEAMAAARPIVAVRAAAVPEVAPHAFFAQPDDPQSLAHQITILYSDPKQRVRSGQEGRRRVEAFDAPLIARQFIEMLEAIPARAA